MEQYTQGLQVILCCRIIVIFNLQQYAQYMLLCHFFLYKTILRNQPIQFSMKQTTKFISALNLCSKALTTPAALGATLNQGKLTTKLAYPLVLQKIKSQISNPKSYQNILKSEWEGKGFYLQQMLTGCLAIYSYYVESNGQSFIIDPQNDISSYIQLIEERKSKLKGVFLTHYHADFVAGHKELQERFGCKIYIGAGAHPQEGITIVEDGGFIRFGEIKMKVMHTPGHTEESSSLLMLDAQRNPQCIFTGDTLFLGEVGRPDLAVKTNLTAEDLAEKLFYSLQKIKSIQKNIRVYPGHGAGSACGKKIGTGDYCYLNKQKKSNYGLTADNSDDFVKTVLKDMPTPPQYFGYNAEINKFSSFSFEEAYQNSSRKLTPEEVEQYLQDDVVVIDVRDRASMSQRMISDAIAISHEGAFATWVGTLLKPKTRYLIYANEEEVALDSIRRMLRIGYINIVGYATFDLAEWRKDTFEPRFVDQSCVHTESGRKSLLDVRTPAEWKKSCIAESKKYELSKIFSKNDKLEKSGEYIIHCRSGYRAMIAYSYLHGQGYNVKVYPGKFETLLQECQ